MKTTKLLITLLAFMMFGVMNAEIASGTCGKNGSNITWVLGDDYTLTLSGSGEMEDYSLSLGSRAPWFNSNEKIQKILICDGVTSIGEWTFLGCSGLTSINIPNSVTSIGEGALSSCSGLTSITIPNSVTSIGERAFNECIYEA